MSRAPLQALQAIVSLGCVLVPTPSKLFAHGRLTVYDIVLFS